MTTRRKQIKCSNYRESALLPPTLKPREFEVRYRFESASGTIDCLDLPNKEWRDSATEKLTVELCSKMGWNESDFRNKATISWI